MTPFGEHDHLSAWWPGPSPAIRAFRQAVSAWLERPADIALLGEAGVGKARAASVLHRLGDRRDGPLILFDPVSDIGAQTRAAAGGMLLIDGGAASPESIEACLAGGKHASRDTAPRVLVTFAVGSAPAKAGGGTSWERFGLPALRLPSLSERVADLPSLCAHFLADLSAAPAVLTEEAMAWVTARAWPGNIRQLRDCVHRAALLGGRRPIDVALLAGAAPGGVLQGISGDFDMLMTRVVDALVGEGALDMVDLHTRVIASVERPLIERVLALTEGNQLRAAGVLGLNRNTLRKRMRELGIGTPRRESARRGVRR